jgi:hypothetical protein
MFFYQSSYPLHTFRFSGREDIRFGLELDNGGGWQHLPDLASEAINLFDGAPSSLHW